jgi:hypothetical protein
MPLISQVVLEKMISQVVLEKSRGERSGRLNHSSTARNIQGERQVIAYPRTQTDQRTVGKANGRRIIGAFRKTLFGTTFRFV